MTTPQIESTGTLQARFTAGALHYLGNRSVLVAIAVLALAAIAAASWNWLVAAGLASIVVSVLPCLVMCGLGLCMHRFFGGSGPQARSAVREPAEGPPQATTDGSTTYVATPAAPANALAEGAAEPNEKNET